jgi:hypothetical protein
MTMNNTSITTQLTQQEIAQKNQNLNINTDQLKKVIQSLQDVIPDIMDFQIFTPLYQLKAQEFFNITS